MTAIWTCQLSVKEALKQKSIKVLGENVLAKNLQDWLCSSVLSKLGTIEKMPVLTWDL
jgi:hypothetical protein